MPENDDRVPSMPPGKPDPTMAWMSEVTLGLERVSGRQAAVEKSLDQLTTEVRDAAGASGAAAEALARIAKAEEDRLVLMREQAREGRQWKERIWSSQPFQLLMTGVVMAVLQLLGVAYLATKFGAAP